MSATAALSIGVVATVTSDPDDVVGAHHGARAGDRPRRARGRTAAAGFLASFISEPVLKGFIIGLALTIMIGQLPALFGHRQGQRQLLREGLGTSSPTSTRPTP